RARPEGRIAYPFDWFGPDMPALHGYATPIDAHVRLTPPIDAGPRSPLIQGSGESKVMSDRKQLLSDMSDRSREIFRRVVEGYLESGEPVGSRTLARSLSEQISAATIRN